MSKKFAMLLRSASVLVACAALTCSAYAQSTSSSAEPASKKASALPEASTPAFKFVADKEKKQTCNKDGTSVAGGTKWCRSGEWHECNGKNGEWVNTRQKCKS